MLVLRGFLQVIWKHEVYLIALVNEVLLVHTSPLIVFCEIVQLDAMDVYSGVLKSVKNLHMLIDLQCFTFTLLQVVNEVHML